MRGNTNLKAFIRLTRKFKKSKMQSVGKMLEIYIWERKIIMKIQIKSLVPYLLKQLMKFITALKIYRKKEVKTSPGAHNIYERV